MDGGADMFAFEHRERSERHQGGSIWFNAIECPMRLKWDFE